MTPDPDEAVVRELIRMAQRLRDDLPTAMTVEAMEAKARAAQSGWAARSGHYTANDLVSAYKRAIGDAAAYLTDAAKRLAKEIEERPAEGAGR